MCMRDEHARRGTPHGRLLGAAPHPEIQTTHHTHGSRAIAGAGGPMAVVLTDARIGRGAPHVKLGAERRPRYWR